MAKKVESPEDRNYQYQGAKRNDVAYKDAQQVRGIKNKDENLLVQEQSATLHLHPAQMLHHCAD